MKVETKFDIDQIVYFFDNSEMYAGAIKDISLREKASGGDVIYYIYCPMFFELSKRTEGEIFSSVAELRKYMIDGGFKENEMVRRGYIKQILQLGGSTEESVAKIVEELLKKINGS